MGKFFDLTGQKFGLWTVLERAGSQKGQPRWLCKCDCGSISEVAGVKLRDRLSLSCGCLVRVHGLSYHRFYNTYNKMMQRCYNPDFISYKDYGFRGISVCDKWRNNSDPTTFLAWCDSQEPIPEGYTLDRKDNDGNYCPENCRFASINEQNRNRRSNVIVEYNNEKLCFEDFVEKYGVVGIRTAMSRVNYGWSYLEAGLIPLRKKRPIAAN